MNDHKKIVFLTGTRADFGKIKSLLTKLNDKDKFSIHVFVTGMHMLKKYGYTCSEVEKCGFKNIHKYVNQNTNDSMDSILAKTISGFSDYIKELNPDLIVVHGDRVETLACASVGSLNNILVAHIEGGEVSGTIDELIRHSTSKLSHIHFTSNDESKNRLIQLGENPDNIFVIGSPDIDIMLSNTLPFLDEVKDRYKIPFSKYNILLFHAVTTEHDDIRNQVKILVDAILESNQNFVVIFPNNDNGSDIILNEYERFKKLPRFKVFPSMRFEYFLTLLKNANCIIGNSSCGIREAPLYGIPTINIGSRQNNRSDSDSIVNINYKKEDILSSLTAADFPIDSKLHKFGLGDSDVQFCNILEDANIWNINNQKKFIDINNINY